MGNLPKVTVVLSDSFLHPAQVIEHVADYRVAPAGERFQRRIRLCFHACSLERQDDSQLAEQAAHSIDKRRTLLDISLAGPVNEQFGLLLDALHRNNLIVGRVTASQIAAASLASFFPLLPAIR